MGAMVEVARGASATSIDPVYRTNVAPGSIKSIPSSARSNRPPGQSHIDSA